MRIALIGATGRTGLEILAQAPERGHQVIPVVRAPARLPVSDRTTARTADACDESALARAFAGVEAVVTAVGPVKGESTVVMRESIAATLSAMKHAAVRRLVVITASGWVVDGDDPMSRFVAKPILNRILRDANDDFEATEQHVRASDADWSIVRPPRLGDGPARGHYRSRRDGNVRWHYSIRRADLAQAVLDVLVDPTSVGATVSVAG